MRCSRSRRTGSYVPREGEPHLVDRVVSNVIGARRSGKSFRVLQAADELLGTGFISSLEQVCPVDYDNAILSTVPARDLGLIQSTFLKINPGYGLKPPLVFILDEIHTGQEQRFERDGVTVNAVPAWRWLLEGRKE